MNHVYRWNLARRPNKSLQSDKGKLSYSLLAHRSRQLAIAAELSC